MAHVRRNEIGDSKNVTVTTGEKKLLPFLPKKLLVSFKFTTWLGGKLFRLVWLDRTIFLLTMIVVVNIERRRLTKSLILYGVSTIFFASGALFYPPSLHPLTPPRDMTKLFFISFNKALDFK